MRSQLLLAVSFLFLQLLSAMNTSLGCWQRLKIPEPTKPAAINTTPHAQQTGEFQKRMRERREKRAADEREAAERNLYVVSARGDEFTALLREANIEKIVTELPRSTTDKKTAHEVLNRLAKYKDRLKDYGKWLADVAKRSPEDKNNMIFEAIQAEAMLRNKPDLVVDMGVDADARATGQAAGHTSKSMDLYVYDKAENIYYKDEVKSIQDRSCPYDAIGSFVDKSLEVSAEEEVPSLKLLALYTDFPRPGVAS